MEAGNAQKATRVAERKLTYAGISAHARGGTAAEASVVAKLAEDW